jgi:acyl carrier protein
MDINDFIEKFTACLNHNPASALLPETEFRKLDDWSSIFALIIIAMIDSDYNKVLSSEDIKNSKTLSDLFNVIESK